MNKIHVLPPELIGKIAAGEVVESPASVVKELIENSLDAGATSIQVNLQQAGKSLIEISDNGSGIAPDDIENVFARHATSKISSLDDLFAVTTLGFRGEALYSIAAVSDIVLQSRVETETAGTELHIRGGSKIDLRPASMNRGTRIAIRELFFNTPARRKFLRSDTTELNRISSVVIPQALFRADCGFSLRHGNRTLLDLRPETDPKVRVARALNVDTQHLIAATRTFAAENLTVRMILGDINIQRPKKDMQFVFVNGRPVVHRGLLYQVNEAFRPIMPGDRNPLFVLFIDLPPQDIDINIHPAKREVKFRDEQAVIALTRAFCEQELMAQGKPRNISPVREYAVPSNREQTPIREARPFMPSHHTPPAAARPAPAEPSWRQPLLPDPAFAQPRTGGDMRSKLERASYIGVFNDTWLLYQSGDSMLVVDQHAAHERINFEALRRQMDAHTIESQRLLTPLELKLSVQEYTNWEQSSETLQAMGFDTKATDGQAVSLHAHPVLINDPGTALRNLLAGDPLTFADTETLARRACRQSVMAGDRLNKPEAENLIQRLLACSEPFTCPHGRPVMIEIEQSFLERRFLRT